MLKNEYIKNWIQLFSIVVIIFLVFKLMQISSEKNSAYRVLKNQIETSKKESEAIVNQKEKEIAYLKRLNEKIDLEIRRKQKTIDSLNILKKQVQVIYFNNVREIKGFNAKQLENYWRNEIR
jgi:hypothetical protein